MLKWIGWEDLQGLFLAKEWWAKAVKEWRHQPADPKARARRHIVVRKQISRRPLAGGKLLFEDLPDYRLSLHVTNLDLPLDQIWKIYNSRADCENRIRELKQDFWATEALFRFIIVAYNLMSLFRHFGLNSHNQATLATLRSYCLATGGWVSQHARKRVLHCPAKNAPGWTPSSAKLKPAPTV
ncbi:MAG: transposase [Prosthecobacter sp.]|uniref:transposase n=1 Tax=Prosthecobacter sp. TaxID=1965333 RepID=UPI0025E2BB04|nr:transposase [Prosthecobacter sp.]MCF7787253.1 transposase [Prosthecobacter sp.]